MRRFDRYIGPLVIFTIGYILCLTIADTLRVGEMHITLNGGAHLWSASATPSPFWTYIAVVGLIGLAFAALGIYSAVSAYRIADPSRLQPTGSLVFLRLVGLWFLIVLLIVTYTFARKWV
jgi:hypothetical protein